MFYYFPIMQDVYKDDKFLADPEFERVSTNPDHQYCRVNKDGQLMNSGDPKEAFELCSDRCARLFPTYKFDGHGIVQPGEDTPTVNFDWLKEFLLSDDMSRMDEMDWVEKGEYRFLDGQVDLTGDRTGFFSYGRSGNTFLRRFLE